MNGNVRTAVLAGIAGLAATALAGCVSPDRTPQDYYQEAPPQRADSAPVQSSTTTYTGNGTTGTTTTTTTTTTSDDGAPYQGDGYAPYGHGDGVYDDPHHYGRGANQHKY